MEAIKNSGALNGVYERDREPIWYINYNDRKDEFYLSEKEESVWVYDGGFYSEEEGIDYFCTHRVEFEGIHNKIKDIDRGVDLVLRYSLNRYVVLVYSHYDIGG